MLCKTPQVINQSHDYHTTRLIQFDTSQDGQEIPDVCTLDNLVRHSVQNV